MSTALTRGWRKAARTVLQIIASGGLTAAVDALAGGMTPEIRAVVAAVWLVVVTFAQNTLEASGRIGVLLPTPGVVPSVGGLVTKGVGTVESSVENVGGAVGEVEGIVTDTAGGLLGEIVDVDRMESEGD
jgi:hypothetical protein